VVVAGQQLHQQVAAHAATGTGRNNGRKHRHWGDDRGTPAAAARGLCHRHRFLVRIFPTQID
jgi:hypothetical protein